jgi:hypothetical protein
VIKLSKVKAILYSFHKDPLAGHFGFAKTYQAINKRYFWPQMGNDIKNVQSCVTCQNKGIYVNIKHIKTIKISIINNQNYNSFIGKLIIAQNYGDLQILQISAFFYVILKLP